MKDNKKPIQPELLYEAEESQNQFPFFQTNKDEKPPVCLFIAEYKETGETEPGPKGEAVPIVDQYMHQFINMTILKEKLKPSLYDEVRIALGLLPLKKAEKLGQEKLDKVMHNVNNIMQEKLDNTNKEGKKQ